MPLLPRPLPLLLYLGAIRSALLAGGLLLELTAGSGTTVAAVIDSDRSVLALAPIGARSPGCALRALGPALALPPLRPSGPLALTSLDGEPLGPSGAFLPHVLTLVSFASRERRTRLAAVVISAAILESLPRRRRRTMAGLRRLPRFAVLTASAAGFAATALVLGCCALGAAILAGPRLGGGRGNDYGGSQQRCQSVLLR